MKNPDDPEVSPLTSRSDAAPRAPRGRLGGRIMAAWRGRWPRALLTTLVLLAASACLIGHMVPDAFQRTSTALFPPARTPPPTATPVIPTPLPATGLFAPPPADCPASPPLDSIVAQPENFREPVMLYGRAPVWIAEGYLPQGTIGVYTAGTPEPYPGIKIIWEVCPTTYPAVTARVTDLCTGELAWWSGGSPRPQTPVLTFQPRVFGAPPAFAEMLSNLILTHAGCYKFDVTWDGGAWYSVFAAGGRTQP